MREKEDKVFGEIRKALLVIDGISLAGLKLTDNPAFAVVLFYSGILTSIGSIQSIIKDRKEEKRLKKLNEDLEKIRIK